MTQQPNNPSAYNQSSRPDDTQPRPPAGLSSINTDATPPRGMPPVQTPLMVPPDMDNDGDSAPGCFVWSIILGFTLILGLGVVVLAGLAGWAEGLDIAQGNATATRSADVSVQCQRIEIDLASGNLGLVQRRFEDLAQLTPAPDCIAMLAPTATAAYNNSLPTATPMATATPVPTATATLMPTSESTAAIVQPTVAITNSGFDLDALYGEAQQAINDSNYRSAIDTLDAISAIDPTYQKANVDNLLFSALTTEARNLYRSGTKLAEANLLVTRAEEFGDVGDLSYERFIAELYLEAQAYRNVNYPLAIQTLRQIVITQGLTGYLDSLAQLINQHVRYGDQLALLGDACAAEAQYTAALGYGGVVPEGLTAKSNEVANNCRLNVVPATIDPNATLDPNATPPPTATEGIAPIGVPGT